MGRLTRNMIVKSVPFIISKPIHTAAAVLGGVCCPRKKAESAKSNKKLTDGGP